LVVVDAASVGAPPVSAYLQTIIWYPELGRVEVLLVMLMETSAGVALGELASTADGIDRIRAKSRASPMRRILCSFIFMVWRVGLVIASGVTIEYVITQLNVTVFVEELREKRHVHISLRIPTDMREELLREAYKQGINFNALGNRIMEKYLSFDRMAERDRSVVMEREVLSAILDKVAVQDLEEIGREFGPRLVKESLFFYGISPTLHDLVTKYFEPAGKYSGRYDFNLVGTSSQPRMVLVHRYGEKWSILLKEYMAGAIESILGGRPRIEAGPDFVTIEFRN